MKTKWSRAQITIAQGLVSISLTSLALYIGRVISAGNLRYRFQVWNLILAWVPLVCAVGLYHWLQKGRWQSWQAVSLALLWLGFLPNSFYLISDFIHLRITGEVSLLYDAVMFTAFALSGILLGFTALYIVQAELRRKLPARTTWFIIEGILLLCSFAIYLGRYLGWNSWDVLVNPSGLIFDVSDRIISPSTYPNTFTTTLMFFVLLSGIYYSLRKLVQGLRGLPE
jgi:uncharacterized membrane protein